MTNYVAGFLFDERASQVVLIEKARPDWQRGSWNGVGGHIEPGETPLEAMMREFDEETGMKPVHWGHFLTLHWPDRTAIGGQEEGRVYFFRSFQLQKALVDYVFPGRVDGELVNIFYMRDISLGLVRTLPNLSWLLPLAAYRHDRYEPLHVWEE